MTTLAESFSQAIKDIIFVKETEWAAAETAADIQEAREDLKTEELIEDVSDISYDLIKAASEGAHSISTLNDYKGCIINTSHLFCVCALLMHITDSERCLANECISTFLNMCKICSN